MSDNFNIAKNEKKILEFWRAEKIFEKTQKNREGKKPFVFYEGPPTANGRPGIHHVLARAFKDLFCRYATMKGFYVRRKAGWDTHGLPVELEVEKKLGFASKQDIEAYGIEKFNAECKKSVWEYKDEWEKITDRMGFWLDIKHPYITYTNEYIESIWAIVKKIWEKKLLYKGHKVVPYCARCGTTLSSHEVAQGYKETEDPSIYVKFRVKNEPDTYFLVWTTTPWTLPGNVALAVGKNIEYVKIKKSVKGGQKFDSYILAKNIYQVIENDPHHPLRFLVAESDFIPNVPTYYLPEDIIGKNLIGKEYEPLYLFMPLEKKAHYVIGADFVSTEDGTGIVHIAPAFGEDDMNVGRENDLPVLMTVDENGRFKNEVAPWAGVFVKDADKSIIKDLGDQKLLACSAGTIKHEYPFCWRCHQPLLYYAKESWFVKMSELRDKLIKNNREINWVPAYLKEGRFGQWLVEIKDWAISRERYWGTPLPVWECTSCGAHDAVGSFAELEEKRHKPKNNYFLMRHGESVNNARGIVSSYPEKETYPLTEKGKKETKAYLETLMEYLKKERLGTIDLMFSSDLLRTKETAEMARDALGIHNVLYDERMREVALGALNNKTMEEFHAYFSGARERYDKRPEGGENWQDVQKRAYEFIADIDKKYGNKNILIVGHGDVLWLLYCLLNDIDGKEEQMAAWYPKNGEWARASLGNVPRDRSGNLDAHRPFIDVIELECPTCKAPMRRVEDVMDVWFDSGSMPFAQDHWPFDGSPKSKVQSQKFQYPADFISEGVDQTRGWFYTLLAIGTLLDKGTPYKNIVSVGLVLDKDGQKMSKSRGNVVNPANAMEIFGADGVRWYFYIVNQAGDAKRFDEAEVLERTRKFILLFHNTFRFLALYASKGTDISLSMSSENILDKWIHNRLQKTVATVGKKLDEYDATSAARELEECVGDLSVWYVRRSRKRFQREKESADRKSAEATLARVLLELAKLSAPFVPFFAEEIYRSLKNTISGYAFKESVHMEEFPSAGAFNEALEEEMKNARNIVALGHRLRAEAKIKVRQPLGVFCIDTKTVPKKPLLEIIADELNVKNVIVGEIPAQYAAVSEGGISAALDIGISPALREEGIVREALRHIQDARKKLSLSPSDKVTVSLSGEQSEAGKEIVAMLARNAEHMKEEALIDELLIGVKDEKLRYEKEFSVEGVGVVITLR